MTSTVITGIGELITNDAELGELTDAALVCEGDRVTWVGPAARAPAADSAVDVAGRAVLPGWVDSHTHLVFAGDRTAEFAARMSGEPYSAGGIAVTVEATRPASDDELAATLAAESGITVFRIAFAQWIREDEHRSLDDIAAQGLRELLTLAATAAPKIPG